MHVKLFALSVVADLLFEKEGGDMHHDIASVNRVERPLLFRGDGQTANGGILLRCTKVPATALIRPLPIDAGITSGTLQSG